MKISNAISSLPIATSGTRTAAANTGGNSFATELSQAQNLPTSSASAQAASRATTSGQPAASGNLAAVIQAQAELTRTEPSSLLGRTPTMGGGSLRDHLPMLNG